VRGGDGIPVEEKGHRYVVPDGTFLNGCIEMNTGIIHTHGWQREVDVRVNILAEKECPRTGHSILSGSDNWMEDYIRPTKIPAEWIQVAYSDIHFKIVCDRYKCCGTELSIIFGIMIIFVQNLINYKTVFIMNIGTFYLPQLHNGEHVAFHSESLEQLNHTGPAVLGVSKQVETYTDTLNEQKQTIDVFVASELSAESDKLDRRRDKAYSAFKAFLKVYANDEDGALSEAAERILFVVRESAIDVGDPLRLGMAKETTAVNSLLRNLEPFRADIELIGAAGRLNELQAANRSFEELQIERNIEKAGKHSGNVKESRAATDAAYKSVVERINAQALLQGGEIFDSFIKEQNAVIEKYDNLVARRKGITKKAKKTETAQQTDN
jgi:hypothetical protein